MANTTITLLALLLPLLFHCEVNHQESIYCYGAKTIKDPLGASATRSIESVIKQCTSSKCIDWQTCISLEISFLDLAEDLVAILVGLTACLDYQRPSYSNLETLKGFR